MNLLRAHQLVQLLLESIQRSFEELRAHLRYRISVQESNYFLENNVA